MIVVLFARARGLGEFFQGVLNGESTSITILVVGIPAFAIIFWLYVQFIKRKGQRLATAIGDCEYHFSPNGLFGKCLFAMTGRKNDITFSLMSNQIGKGDYRTYLEIQKPTAFAWESICSELRESQEGVRAAMSVAETPNAVILEYFGVGGDADFVKTLLREVSVLIQKDGVSGTLSGPQAGVQ